MNKSNPLRVGGVPEHFNLPWHLAIEHNAFADAKFNVEYVDFPGGTGAMTRGLMEREIDVALVLTEGAVAAALRGDTIKIVKVFVESHLIWGIHVSANSHFRRVEDVMGRRYAISRSGSGSHLMAIVDAAERGWETDDMKFVNVGGLEGARSALSAGRADVFLWSRSMTQPFVDNGEFRRIGERSAPWPAFVVAVCEDVLEDRADEIRGILRIVDAECKSLKSNPDAPYLVANRYNLKPSETRIWLEHVRWHSGFDKPIEDLERVIGYLERVGIIETEGANSDQVWRDLQTQVS